MDRSGQGKICKYRQESSFQMAIFDILYVNMFYKRYCLVSTVFDSVEQYAPGFKQSIVGKDILTPPDLEREFGLTGGVFPFTTTKYTY